MKRVCAYCSKVLSEGDGPDEDGLVSHTICEECEEYFRREFEGPPFLLGELLDRFEVPVIAVNSDGHVIAVNQKMASMLGKAQRELVGLLGGEAMECEYSRLPERCGNTIHCKDCTIRNAVQKTIESGRPLLRRPASLLTAGNRVHFYISTYPKDDSVVVIIEELLRREPEAVARRD